MTTSVRTATVREATFELLRAYGMTTIFGNVGSTEEPFLQDLPADFEYVLGLQEASVIAMADGFAQATRRPALVNLHTGVGLGNAMGNLLTAFQNRTPLVVTSGQQTREMLLLEPYLTNADPTTMPRPWVKWAYEPVRPQDVPAAFMRAIATALQPPAGPVFLSLPLDDWDKPSAGPAVVRTVATRVAPDPARLRDVRRRARARVVAGPDLRRGPWRARADGTRRSRSRRRSARRSGPRRPASARRSPRTTRSTAARCHWRSVRSVSGCRARRRVGRRRARCSATTRMSPVRTCPRARVCCTSPTIRPRPPAHRSATASWATPP